MSKEIIDSLKKKHEAYMRNMPKFKDGDRAIWIAPAYEILKDLDNGKNYGRHGVTIHFGLRQGDRAVTTEFYTCYQTNDMATRRHAEITTDLTCTGLYYHFHTKTIAVNEYAREGDDCLLFEDGICWGQAGSALHGDDMTLMLVNQGSGAIFEEMERAIREDFEPDEYDIERHQRTDNAADDVSEPMSNSLQQLEETVTEDIRKAVKYPHEKVDPYLINQIITAAKAYASAIVGDDENQNILDNPMAIELEVYARNVLRSELRREIGK